MSLRITTMMMVVTLFATVRVSAQVAKTSYDGPKEKLHVYLLTGGFNMAGSAPYSKADDAVLDRCYLLNGDDVWESATLPLNRYSPIRDKGGKPGLNPGVSFAKAMLAASPDISIGLIVNATKATKIEDWGRKSKYYRQARRRMKVAAKTGTLKGVLWHQGEDDLKAPEGYLDQLMDLIVHLRCYLDTPELPVVVGQLHDGKAINDQLAKLPVRAHATGVVSVEGLKANDNRHFDAASMTLLGERYATEMQKIQKAQLPAKTFEPPPGTTYVDAHLHAFSCQKDGLDPVANWMAANKVERSIIHPLNHKGSRPKSEEERQQMLANFRKYKGKIYRFCIYEPDDFDTPDAAVAWLKKEKADGAIGFGEHYGRGLKFDDPKNMRIYAACEAVGLPVMFHIDTGKNMDEAGLPRLERVLKAYPKCILIAHSQWWFHLPDGSCDRLLRKYPNLYADLSPNAYLMLNRDRAYSREFLIRHADRMLFGTDAGWWSFGKGKPRHPEFTLLERLNLPDTVKNKIFRTNAETLFGFTNAK